MVDLMAEGVGSFVDGRWIGGTPFEVERPADCSTVCTAASASPSAVEQAVDWPRRSFDSDKWSSAHAPGGGSKQSGLGRERGGEGIRWYQELKHMAIGEFR
jgi:acyl-CoA reductase-like NAD-dependent aldehyde dehydrogenase